MQGFMERLNLELPTVTGALKPRIRQSLPILSIFRETLFQFLSKSFAQFFREREMGY